MTAPAYLVHLDSYKRLICASLVLQDETIDHDVKLHRVERSTTFMKRSLRMPDSADLSKITARYQDGVLNLDIPKHEVPVAAHC